MAEEQKRQVVVWAWNGDDGWEAVYSEEGEKVAIEVDADGNLHVNIGGE